MFVVSGNKITVYGFIIPLMSQDNECSFQVLTNHNLAQQNCTHPTSPLSVNFYLFIEKSMYVLITHSLSFHFSHNPSSLLLTSCAFFFPPHSVCSVLLVCMWTGSLLEHGQFLRAHIPVASRLWGFLSSLPNSCRGVDWFDL